MLTLILHPMLRQMEGPEFARFLRGFLPTARHAPFNYIAILGMVVPAGWEALRTRYFAFQCPMERYSNPEVRQAVERLHQHLR